MGLAEFSLVEQDDFAVNIHLLEGPAELLLDLTAEGVHFLHFVLQYLGMKIKARRNDDIVG